MKIKNLYSKNGRFYLFIILLHLILVFTISSKIVDLFKFNTKVAKLVNIYASFAGANYSYEFFSPGISNDLRLNIEIKDQYNNLRNFQFGQNLNREAELKVTGFLIDYEEKNKAKVVDRYNKLNMSLVKALFIQNPEAVSIKLIFEDYVLVDRKMYAQGKRHDWVFLSAVEYQKESGKN